MSLTREQVDASDVDQVLRALDVIRPAAVVNCAVIADFARSADSAAMARVNVKMPTGLARWCQQNDVHLVQPSTAVVHGVRFAFASRETTINLDSVYGAQKFEADQAVEGSGCRSSIFRLGGIYGKDGPSHLGLNAAIMAALSGSPPTIVGEGVARRNYVHCDAVADAMLFALLNKICGMFYFGGREILSIAEMMSQICQTILPGRSPARMAGPEASDSIVALDDRFPLQPTFSECLRSIRDSSIPAQGT